MSLIFSRRVRRIAASVAVLSTAACADRMAGPGAAPDGAQMRITASVAAAADVATLVVTVTAPDIATPLVYNLTVVNGTATGTIKMPPGAARTISVKALDAAGNVTSEGSKTVQQVSAGNGNPPVSIPMVSKAGHVDVTVQLGAVSVVVQGGTTSIGISLTSQLTAVVTAPNGEVLTVTPEWATADPSIATVSSTGLVKGVRTGATSIVAMYAGVAGVAQVTVQGGAPVTYGNASDFGSGKIPSAENVIASKVTVSAPGVVDRLGYIARKAGGTLRLALYSDDAGLPGHLLTQTGATTAIAGSNEVTVPGVNVTSGTYWIAMQTNGVAEIGYDLGPTTPNVLYVTYLIGLSDPFRADYSSNLTFTDRRYNLFIAGYQN